MFKRFYPKEYLDSVYDIDFQKLYEKGYRGIISDIDNTLVPHGAPATEEIIKLFERIHSLGFETCLISNNKEPRVAPFAEKVNSKYIYNAHKPSRTNYNKAMELMGTTSENTIFLGDQVFTDVWGANRCSIPSVMLKPIDKKEEIQIIIKRIPEKLIMWCWKRSQKK